MSRIEDRRILTYGANPQADVRFTDLRFESGASRFSVEIRNRITGASETIPALELPMPGRHNVSNATAAVAVAYQLGIPAEAIRRGLAAFGGVKRRFTRTGVWNGVTVYDDYGHHPVEIMAVLRAARESATGRVVAVVQPHRYTACRASSPTSASASTTPTPCWWPTSTPPASSRSRGRTRLPSSRAPKRPATATCARWRVRRRWPPR